MSIGSGWFPEEPEDKFSREQMIAIELLREKLKEVFEQMKLTKYRGVNGPRWYG